MLDVSLTSRTEEICYAYNSREFFSWKINGSKISRGLAMSSVGDLQAAICPAMHDGGLAARSKCECEGFCERSGFDQEFKVFDPAIRGHTDQFVYKFRKPGTPSAR